MLIDTYMVLLQYFLEASIKQVNCPQIDSDDEYDDIEEQQEKQDAQIMHFQSYWGTIYLTLNQTCNIALFEDMNQNLKVALT